MKSREKIGFHICVYIYNFQCSLHPYPKARVPFGNIPLQLEKIYLAFLVVQVWWWWIFLVLIYLKMSLFCLYSWRIFLFTIEFWIPWAAFPPSSILNIVYSLLHSTFSDQKSVITWIFISLYVMCKRPFFSGCFQYFLWGFFAVWFYVCKCVFHRIYPAWGLMRFLNL